MHTLRVSSQDVTDIISLLLPCNPEEQDNFTWFYNEVYQEHDMPEKP